MKKQSSESNFDQKIACRLPPWVKVFLSMRLWKVLTNLCCNPKKPLACPIYNLPTISLCTVSNVYSVEEILHKYSPLSEAWRCFNVMGKSLWSLRALFHENPESLVAVYCEESRCQSKTEYIPFCILDQVTLKFWFCREKLLLTVHQSKMDSLWFIQWLPKNRNKKETCEDKTVGWIF